MSIDVILIAFLAVPVALTVVAASAVLIAGRAAPDAPAGYPGLRRLRRVAGATRLLAIVLGLVGRARAKRVGPPQRALEQVQQTKLALAGRGDAATTPTATPTPTPTPTP